MKLRNILLAGVAVTGLMTTSCNDYLDVDSPSMFEYDYVYSTTYDMNLALNGVYAKLMSPYSSLLVNNLILNSDIDFATFTSDTYGTGNSKRFDSTAESADANNLWRQCYNGIEYCNMFIAGVESSSIFDEEDADIMQMLGEAYCIRAILYHELVWYFGDIPYSRVPATKADDVRFPVVDRHTILDDMIADVEAIAPKMKATAEISEGVERIGRELAYGLLARMSLTAGGYTLEADKNDKTSVGIMKRPDNYLDYYKKAEKYAGEVIAMNSHSLTKSFIDVFVDECNNGINNSDDPIFEIPFAKDNSGNIGYIHGPKFNTNDSQTNYSWGGTSSSVRLHGLAPYLFDPDDIRQKYLFGIWNYAYDGKPSFESDSYTLYNNKWSKLWAKQGLGNTSAGSTGINFPYMRYTDILLMFAEASNEVHNGPTPEAVAALKQVRERAFRHTGNTADKVDAYIANASTKDAFLDIVLDERKFEFAGENLRWRDLVRNNIYGRELYYTFLRHCLIADQKIGQGDSYADKLTEHDGLSEGFYSDQIMLYPYYRTLENVGTVETMRLDGVDSDVAVDPIKVSAFPNTQLQYVDVYKIWSKYTADEAKKAKRVKANGATENLYNLTIENEMYNKHRSGDGYISAEVCYSLLGYVYRDRNTEVEYISNGHRTGVINSDFTAITDVPAEFPPVRYILPYPAAAIRDGAGVYVNYYGY